ncbi:uncharacterized protein LOC130895209 [Diorhabda carinulata]|uniref:uncharacterized protein LOC130895209 n=1 Tax=Diorhabda carinulata TaxID=1163345 RepID=UPI0025A1CD93|nr:uncharacterized protein LOC130895209 [Diorhabda carinulata]
MAMDKFKFRKNIQISTIINIHRKLWEIIQDVNSIFGMQIFLGLLESGVLTLYYVNAINFNIQRGIFIKIIMFSILTVTELMLPILTISASDWMTTESQKLLMVCYGFQEDFSFFSSENLELFNLKNHIDVTKPKMTACGFYELNSKLIFTLFGTLTTFFFIIIQFNKKV